MNKFTLLALTLLTCAIPCLAVPGAEFSVKKVELSSPTSPDFQLGGNDIGVKWTPQKWARLDVTFEAAPEWTDELMFTYYVLFGDRLLVGHVNHVNIAKGRDLHSVMYISPQAIMRIMQKKLVNMSTLPITQVTVTVSKPGVIAPLAIGNLKPAGTGQWWTTMKQEDGFLSNKSETPFAPLFWDYYEAVKSAPGR